MSWIRRAVVAPTVERRDAPPAWNGDALTIPAPGTNMFGSGGPNVTDRSALSMMTFFRGVQLISDSVSQTPLRAVRHMSDGTRVPLPVSPEAITDPFMAFSLEEGISQIVVSLILRGNAYLVAVAWNKSTAVPTKWRILSPDQVSVDWDDNGFRQYTVNGVVQNAAAIKHIAAFMLPNSTKGAGVVEYCRTSLSLGLSLTEAARQFFQNGIQTTGIIGVDAPLTPDEARAAAEQFVQHHSGAANAGMPIVMSGGAKYTPISLTAEDAQFLESRQFQQGEIATMLGIPPHLLGMVDRTTSWGTGIEVQGRAFVDYTLRTYFKRLIAMFTSWLESGTFAEFITDDLIRADTTVRFAGYKESLTDGWLSVDEVRMREGLPPLANGAGAIYRVPMTQVAIANADGAVTPSPATDIPAESPQTGDPNAGD